MAKTIARYAFISMLATLSSIGTCYAQAVSNVSEPAKTCILFIKNNMTAPAQVGVSNGANTNVNPNSQGKLELSCIVLQKTAANYSNILKQETATIGDAPATYTLSLKEQTTTETLVSKPGNSASTEATTTKLSTDASDYLWVTTSAKFSIQ